MSEKNYSNPIEKKSVDELVLKRGQEHQEALKAIAEKLKTSFNSPSLFNEESQKELDFWMESSKEEILRLLEHAYLELQGMKSTHSPGHDIAHLLDNLNSALKIFEEYGDFSEAEKLEVVLSCLGHDLGRFVEKELDNINVKDTMFLMPAIVGRRIKGINKLPDSLQLRVLYNIASGSVPKTENRTSDVVHQCDREYLTGSSTVARDLAFDVIISDRELMVPLKEELKTRLPIPESEDDRWFLVQMEFFMRNIYPPVSPDGGVTLNGMKQNNAVIEMLATEEKGDEFNQVFSVELGLVSPESLHWSKKPVPAEVFEAAKKEKDEFIRNITMSEYTPGCELEVMKEIVASDKISLPPNFEIIMNEKLARCTEQELKNIWLVIKYALHKRHDRRIQDLKFLESYKNDEGVSGLVAQWVTEEMESREEVYRKFKTEK